MLHTFWDQNSVQAFKTVLLGYMVLNCSALLSPGSYRIEVGGLSKVLSPYKCDNIDNVEISFSAQSLNTHTYNNGTFFIGCWAVLSGVWHSWPGHSHSDPVFLYINERSFNKHLRDRLTPIGFLNCSIARWVNRMIVNFIKAEQELRYLPTRASLDPCTITVSISSLLVFYTVPQPEWDSFWRKESIASFNIFWLPKSFIVPQAQKTPTL